MTGKLLIAFVFTFSAGVFVGYFLPQNEKNAEMEPEIELGSPISSVESGGRDLPSQNGDEASLPAEFTPTTGTNGLNSRNVQARKRARQIQGHVFAFIGFDAQGQESGHWPAAPLTEGEFLVPALALKAVVSGQVASPSGKRSRVTKVRGLGERGAFAVITADCESKLWLRRTAPIEPDEVIWMLDASGRSSVPQPTTVERRTFDPSLRLEFVHLVDYFSLSSGGLVLDAKDQLVALAFPADEDGKTKALDIAEFRFDRLRILDLKLADYFKIYFAGSIDALLKEARHHFAGRRFAKAIEVYRIIADRGSQARDTIHDEFLEAILGRLDELPLASNSRERIRFLRQALRDFPEVGNFWFELALVARKLREYEEALRAWETAWKTNSDLVTDLVGAKNSIYLEWINSHVDRDRIDSALQVIQIALADTGGSSEILLLYGKLLIRRRAYLAAADAMRDAVQLDPSLGSTLNDTIARAERLAEGPGKVVIDYPPGSRSIIVSVSLNGRASGDFIVDTGATTTMVPSDLARRAGLDTSDRVPKVRLQTASTERIVPFSPVDTLSLGVLSVNRISVVVGDISGKSGHGLLGMDFLGEFHIETDSQNGRMVLSSRN